MIEGLKTQAAEITSRLTYGVGGFLVFGDWLDFLNDNAGAVGVGIAALTFLANIWFRVLELRERRNNK